MNAHKSLVILLALLICGCASGYKAIKPESIAYTSTATLNNVVFKYKYGVLTKRYAKKEAKHHLKLVAVAITNNTDNDLVFGKTITLSYPDKAADIIPLTQVYQETRQGAAIYLLYLLLTPAKFVSGGAGPTSTVPIGFAIGPGLTLGNMVAVNNANNNYKRELLKDDLNGVTIKKGQTVYGLVGLRSDNYDALKVTLQ